MIRLELLRWVRSRRLAILVIVFVFSGITSPLSAFYTEQILAGLGDEGVQVSVPDPTWQSLLLAYFQNASQLALLFAAYLAGWGCALGGDDRLRIFYLSRVRRPSQVFVPRLVVSGLVVLLAALVGASTSAYATWALMPDLDPRGTATALGVQVVGVVGVAVLAGAVAALVRSPLVATVLVFVAVLLGGVLGGSESVQRWSPTSLLSPAAVLDAPGAWTDHAWAFVVLLAVVSAAVAVLLLRPLRCLDGGVPVPRPEVARVPEVSPA